MSNKNGRTQIRIVQAVSAMLMGKSVLHVSGTAGAARDALNYAKSWLASNGWMEQGVAPIGVCSRTLTLRFGVGELKFACMETSQGLRYATVMNDHFVEECIEANAKKAEQGADKNTIAKLMVKHGWLYVEGYGVVYHSEGVPNQRTVRLNLKQRTAE